MVFTGRDRDECLEFILGVKKEAFAKGMQRNDDWTAHLAEAHMGGEALVWFEGLDEEVQDSWKLLKRELLAKYSSDQQGVA